MLDDLEVRVAVSSGIKSKEIECVFAKNRFLFKFKMVSGELCIEGEFYVVIILDECYWMLEDNVYVLCFL